MTVEIAKITLPNNVSPKAELQSRPINGIKQIHGSPELLPAMNETGKLTAGLRLAPADSFSTIQPDGAVKIRFGVEPQDKITSPETVISWFSNTVMANPEGPALKVKREGAWKSWSYKEYLHDVRTAAKGFIFLGLEPFHSVGIMGFNAPEWFISDMGAIFAGGLAVGIYTTNTPEACLYNATDAQMNIIVVEDDKQLQKILQIRDKLPKLKAIVQYIGKPCQSYPNVYGWEELMKFGAGLPDARLEERHANIAPNKCCTIIYTSGTTGNPKGAMLSHDNLIWTAKAAGLMVQLGTDDVFVSYLPLSHVAAQMTDLFLPITSGGVVYFCQPDALKGTLVDTLKEARPTALIGVPRVWEKMEEKMRAASKQNSALKQSVARWAKDIGLRGNYNKMKGESTPFGWTLANALVFKKVRQALGLDRCRFTCSGAAPMMKETQEFFLSLDIPIYDIYGMSECSAPHTINVAGQFKLGSAGKELPGMKTKIDKPDADGNGEICMFGRHVFMGYLGQKEKTEEALDSEGYLRTGDLGKKDADGFLVITGRLKELIITAGGENIPPVALEDNLKGELPIISQAMVIGDKRKFLSVILTLKSDIDMNTGEPLNRLTKPAQDWIKDNCGYVTVATVDEARSLESVKTAVAKAIERANKKAVSRAQIIQKFEILPMDFSIPGGELGPTMKLKRSYTAKKYAEVIDALYAVNDTE